MYTADYYQQFTLENGRISAAGSRMQDKLSAIPLPDLAGKSVLDVGCDMGFWSFLAEANGAARVLGLDRGRETKAGEVFTPKRTLDCGRREGFKAEFQQFEAGRQWGQFGAFDVVFLFSLYHHIYAQCADHDAIWLWLRMHTREQLIWENPTSDRDVVVRANVPTEFRAGYTPQAIFSAAERYFDAEYIGPAKHEETREVWRFTPKAIAHPMYPGETQSGAGGASKAFLARDSLRTKVIANALGWSPYPGTLNVQTHEPFGWGCGRFPLVVPELVDRSKGIDSQWAPRLAHVYPVDIDGQPAAAFRFDAEHYPDNFLELIAPQRLRDVVGSNVTVTAWP